MKKLQIVLGVVVAAFLVEATIMTFVVGPAAAVQAIEASPITMLMALELFLWGGVAAMWMWRDARERGQSAMPYIALSFLLGPGAPLLYLIRTTRSEPTASGMEARATA